MNKNKSKDIYILGISGFYHDSAAVILKNDEIIAAVSEERFTRKKNDQSFPKESIKYCLDYSGLKLNDLDAIVFYEKPFIKFGRLLETYYIYAPSGLKSFISAIPVWIKEKLFLKRTILKALEELDKDFDISKSKMLFTEHHLSHASSAFFPSPFSSAAILTIDGVGEWATATISHGKNNNIRMLRELKYPHSLGLLYSAFTYFLGFKVNSGEYKLMGLAPYGNPNSKRVKRFVEQIKSEIVDIKSDGSLWLNQDYFDYSTGLHMIHEEKWKDLFGFPKRDEESDPEPHHCDLALAIQYVTEEAILKMAETAKKLTGENNICLAGGVALNCVASGKLLKKKTFEKLWIQPAAGDAGGALGAAYAAYHMYFAAPRKVPLTGDKMQGSYLGPEYSSLDIEKVARKYKAVYKKHDFDNLIDLIATYLKDGKIIGWFQGRLEWGPRALGNRSILGDARNKDMQKNLNLYIKYREGFRPFAPSVLIESTKDYFDIDVSSPYMLLIANVVEKRRRQLPNNYHDLPLKDMLYFVRSDLPAITHLDFSARLQTVHKDTNPKYWSLINKFKEKTGYGVIVNTSFNVRGEPIVCSPEDAYKCFMNTEMDYLVLGDYLFDKKEQPVYNENKRILDIKELD